MFSFSTVIQKQTNVRTRMNLKNLEVFNYCFSSFFFGQRSTYEKTTKWIIFPHRAVEARQYRFIKWFIRCAGKSQKPLKRRTTGYRHTLWKEHTFLHSVAAWQTSRLNFAYVCSETHARKCNVIYAAGLFCFTCRYAHNTHVKRMNYSIIYVTSNQWLAIANFHKLYTVS